MAKKVTRKCMVCKEPINIFEDTDSYFMEEKNGVRKFCHCNCYVDKQTHKKRSPKTEEECMEYIEKCKEDFSLENYTKATKEELFNYVMDMYDISYAPTYFYTRFEEVFDGEYKGLKKPVPPIDLLDMWKQKRNYLLKVYEQNKKKDKEIKGIGRVWYDLSILLSRYDSYLSWKEQQKLALVETEQKKKEQIEFVEYKDISKKSINTKENSKVDIYSMLDEI